MCKFPDFLYDKQLFQSQLGEYFVVYFLDVNGKKSKVADR